MLHYKLKCLILCRYFVPLSYGQKIVIAYCLRQTYLGLSSGRVIIKMEQRMKTMT